MLLKGGALKQVCLVIGAGAGIGGHVAKRFAREGYHIVMCRRSNKEGLQKIIEERPAPKVETDIINEMS